MATFPNVTASELGALTDWSGRDPRHQGTDDRGGERVAVTLFSEMSLEHLIVSTACRPEFRPLFNASAPDWNRSFRWRGVDPRSNDIGSDALQSLIQSSFSEPNGAGTTHHSVSPAPTAYRWTWLALIGVKLKVDGGVSIVRNFNDAATCRLAIDKWQAAYYLDFRNQPRSRLRRILQRLMQWRFSLSHAGTT